jgi:inositol phosphorylceramide synthase catalytic subunit
VTRVWAHMRALWPRFTLLPIAPFWLWTALCAVRGQLRWDHVAVCLLTAALAYGNARSKRLFFGMVPLALVALFYDAMRSVKNLGLTPENVHVCDLRALEMRFFGIAMHGARTTVHDYLQAHATPMLDALCAIPYCIFIYVVAAYALFLYVRDYPGLMRFTWGFLLLNLAGFLTYHIYPAAPPWYFHAHGCHVDLLAPASEGPNLARVDARLGFGYFAGFYRRSSDVFGAVPSLHVAYPLLMLIQGFRLHQLFGRTLLVLFYVVMCFAAVYLDHHWIVDIVAGSIYTVLVALLMQRVLPDKLWHSTPVLERAAQ